MRKIFVYIVLISFLFRVFYSSLHFAFYIFDEEDYIALFCENKDKPQLHCNGQCSLNKASKKSLETEQQDKNLVKISAELANYIFTEPIVIHFSNNIDTKQKPIALYQRNYQYLFSKTLLHPPDNLINTTA